MGGESRKADSHAYARGHSQERRQAAGKGAVQCSVQMEGGRRREGRGGRGRLQTRRRTIAQAAAVATDIVIYSKF